MGGDYYPSILTYGFQFTYDDLREFIWGDNQPDDDEITRKTSEDDYDTENVKIIKEMEKCVYEKFGLNLLHFVDEAYSRWEGLELDNNDYLFVIGDSIKPRGSNLIDELKNVEGRLKEKLERVSQQFNPPRQATYQLGVIVDCLIFRTS